VDSKCGWFSDRSACYLASGRPVVAHDTGFADFIPAGEGLLTFETAEEAAAALERVAGDYARHRDAARSLAEEHLDSDIVLTRLVEAVSS
jgi:glycosyltransferase involved in cell wall biosynthesis